MPATQLPDSNQVGQTVSRPIGEVSPPKPPTELKSLPNHLKYTYLGQVLEKLAGKSHYYFLDGYSKYMQIHIAPKDQHKTTFTCPFGTFAYTRMPFGLCNAPSTF
ncbi:hypothetical protein CR513_05505, partial [Mucuna pruriens]